jgi:hypothetical protein
MPERWIVLPAGAGPEVQSGFSEVLAVHAALLPNGKVLFFGGSQHLYDATLRSIDDPRLDNTRLWDPRTRSVERAPSPRPLYDLFCSGHAFLADGSLLVAGGTSAYPPPDDDFHHAHYRGSRRSARFDSSAPPSQPWLAAAELCREERDNRNLNPDQSRGDGGRWYPSLVTLGDGNVAAFGGHPEQADDRHSNTTVEVFVPSGRGPGAWLRAGREPAGAVAATSDRGLRIPEVYPRVCLLPNGRVFVACLADGRTYSWDPYARSTSGETNGWGDMAAFPAGPTPNRSDANQSAWERTYFDTGRVDYSRTFFAWSTALLPLLPENDYTARVLLVGRMQPYVIELGTHEDPWPRSAAWRPTSPRDTSHPELFSPSPLRRNVIPETEYPGRGGFENGRNVRFTNVTGMRQQCLAVLLPDATVLVLGGSTTHPSDWSGYFFDGVLLPEVYDPATDRWRTIATPAHVPRVYHGVALLLADGSVWSAGSNPFGDGRLDDRELRIEIFEPWYFDRARPVISDTPAEVRHGGRFEVRTPQAAAIRRVAAIRAASATHGFVYDQRYVGLQFRVLAPDRLEVTAPPDSWIAPPGFYLLFIIDGAGVPSIGAFLRIRFGWHPWFALGANVFPADRGVTAVSTRPGGTSLFVVGLDNEGRGGGRVWSTFFPDAHDQWSGWFALGDNVFRPGSRISALSLGEGRTSLYVIGLDGRVWSDFFPRPDGRPEWSGWFPIGANVFPADAVVTAVSTRPGGTSLFVVGLDNEGRGGGRVWSTFFPDARNQWSGWFALGDNVFRPGSRISALSLGEGRTSLYVVGLDGRVWSNFFPRPDGRPEWSGWFPIGANVFPADAVVTAVSTRPGGTSLFVVGLDNEGRGGGRVWSAFFPDARSQWSAWFALGDNVFRPGSSISALSLGEGQTSLYLTGLDGKVWSNFFPRPDGQHEWLGWFPIGPIAFRTVAEPVALSTRPGGTSLFVPGSDGRIWSAYFDPRT